MIPEERRDRYATFRVDIDDVRSVEHWRLCLPLKAISSARIFLSCSPAFQFRSTFGNKWSEIGQYGIITHIPRKKVNIRRFSQIKFGFEFQET